MEIFNEFITPAELTGYARASLADRSENEFVLARWLPNQNVSDLVYRFSRGGGGLTEAANFRAYDAEPDFGSREGITRVTGELPPIARQMLLDEYSQLRSRAPGAMEEVRDYLLRDGARLTDQISARMELARGDALVNGSVTLNENGVQATVDFGRSASHSQNAAIAWADHDDSLILDDLETWTQIYVDSNGQMPGAFVIDRVFARHIVRNEQIQGELFPNNTGRRVTLTALNEYLQELGYPELTIYDAQIKRNGVATRIIPQGRLLMLPASGDANDPETGQLGATLWGTTLESQEPEYGIESGDESGIVVGAFKQKTTPVQVVTIASAIALPVIANADLTLVADVA